MSCSKNATPKTLDSSDSTPQGPRNMSPCLAQPVHPMIGVQQSIAVCTYPMNLAVCMHPVTRLLQAPLKSKYIALMSISGRRSLTIPCLRPCSPERTAQTWQQRRPATRRCSLYAPRRSPRAANEDAAFCSQRCQDKVRGPCSVTRCLQLVQLEAPTARVQTLRTAWPMAKPQQSPTWPMRTSAHTDPAACAETRGDALN